MMRRMGDGLGDIPDPLGRAERAMHDAAQALRGGRPGAAIGPQTDALDQLQQAAREFAQQMQQRLGNAWGEPADRGDGTGQPRERGERDPLGRPMANGGAYDQGDVKIPDQDTMRQGPPDPRRAAPSRRRDATGRKSSATISTGCCSSFERAAAPNRCTGSAPGGPTGPAPGSGRGPSGPEPDQRKSLIKSRNASSRS